MSALYGVLVYAVLIDGSSFQMPLPPHIMALQMNKEQCEQFAKGFKQSFDSADSIEGEVFVDCHPYRDRSI